MRKTGQVLFCILLCEVVGFLAIPFTFAAIPTWYANLHKPFFSPPNFVFGLVWTTLYALMGVSLFLIWQQGFKKAKVKHAMYVFFVQLFVNFLWSFLFFGLHCPLLGLIDIVLLIVLILVTMKKFYPLSKPAFYLLLPYILWVSFAAIINLSILLLNWS